MTASCVKMAGVREENVQGADRVERKPKTRVADSKYTEEKAKGKLIKTEQIKLINNNYIMYK